MTIAQLVVQIGADVGTLQKDVGQIHSQLDSVVGVAGKVASALGIAFSVGAVVNFAKEIISFASDMKDLSVQTGIGVERLQALNLVGQQSGVTFDMIGAAVAQLSKRLVGGSDGAVEAVERLGLNVHQLLNMDPDLAFIRIAEAVAGIPNPMERSALMMELFGKSGAQFLPLVTENLKALVDEAERTGPILGEDAVEALDAIDDAMVGFGTSAKVAGGEMVLFFSVFHEFNASNAASRFKSDVQEAKEQADALSGAMDAVTKSGSALKTVGLEPVKLSMSEIAKISDELTNSALKKIEQGFEKAARATEKMREELNKLERDLTGNYLQKLADRNDQIIEKTERLAAELNRIETDISNEYLEQLARRLQAAQAMLDAEEAAYRRHRNDVGEILMQQDRDAMDNWARMLGQGQDWFSKMEDLFTQFGETFEFVFGPQFAKAMGHFADSMRHGREMMSGIMRGLSGDFTGWISAAMSAINMLRSAWQGLQELFGGGEEGTTVNPARDTFLSQFGPGGTGPGSGFHTLASMLTELGAGPGGGALFAALTSANTMALFRPAAQMIVDFLREHGRKAEMNFHSGGMVPGFGEVNARLLGGERVQSRREVGEMAGMLGEMRAMNANLMRMFDELPRQMQAAGQMARGRGLSHA